MRGLRCPDAVRPSPYLDGTEATMCASSVEDKPPIGMVGDGDDSSGRDRNMMRFTRKGNPIDAPNRRDADHEQRLGSMIGDPRSPPVWREGKVMRLRSQRNRPYEPESRKSIDMKLPLPVGHPQATVRPENDVVGSLACRQIPDCHPHP